MHLNMAFHLLVAPDCLLVVVQSVSVYLLLILQHVTPDPQCPSRSMIYIYKLLAKYLSAIHKFIPQDSGKAAMVSCGGSLLNHKLFPICFPSSKLHRIFVDF